MEAIKAYTRRNHTKSRNGCSQCKVRRIKCNEVHPVCSNCQRRQIICDFQQVTTPESQGQGQGQGQDSSKLEYQRSQSFISSDNDLSPSTMSDGIPANHSLDTDNMELLHHFTTSTYKTLASNGIGDYSSLWRVHAIREGFKHKFLLRSILTVSASHLAHLRPAQKEKYHELAVSHYNSALELAQEVIAHTDDDNCVAVFLFSCLVVVMSFADGRWTQPEDFIPNVVNILGLLRGCNSVLQVHWGTLRMSVVGRLLEEVSRYDVVPTYSIPEAAQFAALFSMSAAPSLDSGRQITSNFATLELMKAMTQAFLLKSRQQAYTLAIFTWPHALPESYIINLAEAKPESLIVLAYYAVLLQWADNEWYLSGLAQQLLQNIRTKLDPDWHWWLTWPTEVIGPKSMQMQTGP